MKTYLTYGFGMALAGALIALVMNSLGFHNDPSKILVGMVVSFVLGITVSAVLLFLAQRSARNAAPGAFTYGQAFMVGLLASLVAALGNVVFTYIYYAFINPDSFEAIIAWTTELMEKMNTPQHVIDEKVEEMRTSMTPLRQSVSAFFAALIGGTLLSLITGAFNRRKAEVPASSASAI